MIGTFARIPGNGIISQHDVIKLEVGILIGYFEHLAIFYGLFALFCRMVNKNETPNLLQTLK